MLRMQYAFIAHERPLDARNAVLVPSPKQRPLKRLRRRSSALPWSKTGRSPRVALGFLKFRVECHTCSLFTGVWTRGLQAGLPASCPFGAWNDFWGQQAGLPAFCPLLGPNFDIPVATEYEFSIVGGQQAGLPAYAPSGGVIFPSRGRREAPGVGFSVAEQSCFRSCWLCFWLKAVKNQLGNAKK